MNYIQTATKKILARYQWNDGNRGVFDSVISHRFWLFCLLFPVSLQRQQRIVGDDSTDLEHDLCRV